MQSDEVLEMVEKMWGLEFTGRQKEQLNQYVGLLYEWTTRVRLVSRKDREFIWDRHVLDCLTVVPYLPVQGRHFDLGSGAGLPGLIIKIMMPSLEVFLLEPARMKHLFLKEAVDRLGLDGVYAIKQRSEQLVEDPEFKGRFAVGTARAVAQLPQLWAWSEPLLKEDGILIAMKGPAPLEEWSQRDHRSVRVKEMVLPITDKQRSLVFIAKDKSEKKE